MCLRLFWPISIGSENLDLASKVCKAKDTILHHLKIPETPISNVNTNKQLFQPWFQHGASPNFATIHSNVNHGLINPWLINRGWCPLLWGIRPLLEGTPP